MEVSKHNGSRFVGGAIASWEIWETATFDAIFGSDRSTISRWCE
ncbi:hypothetical protein CKA32_004244 [Geitlerinema sp. FC II]|nr:hypothetical protein CKA32_004244 [Geitlerinema sp. FC II]